MTSIVVHNYMFEIAYMIKKSPSYYLRKSHEQRIAVIFLLKQQILFKTPLITIKVRHNYLNKTKILKFKYSFSLRFSFIKANNAKI